MTETSTASTPLRVTIVGTGYVGLVSGACFADIGHHVICVDKDANKLATLKAGESPIYEPGLDDLLEKNIASGRIEFSDDLASSLVDADLVFIAVGTPMGERGAADLTYVQAAAEAIAHASSDGIVVVTKSTVPVGTNEKVEAWIRAVRPELSFEVASNPEFLREGAAIGDFMKPDRIVVGCKSRVASDRLARLYEPLTRRGAVLLTTDLPSAELIKYAANAFLATKVGFINQISDLCEALGGDISHVARGIGLDTRIGSKFLAPGPGFGGSCFPKDTNALIKTAHSARKSASIVESVVRANKERKGDVADRIMELSAPDFRVGILGATFKAGTDDVRESPFIDIVKLVTWAGAKVTVFDPEGMEGAKTELGRFELPIEWAKCAYGAARDKDLLVIMTEWPSFLEMDLEVCAGLMRKPVMYDLRSLFADRVPTAFGFEEYHCVGRQPVRR